MTSRSGESSGSSSDYDDSSGSESESHSTTASSSRSAGGTTQSEEADTMDVNSGNLRGSKDSKLFDSECDSTDTADTGQKKNNIKEILREAATQPDLYGVRRSDRQRREVNRLMIEKEEHKPRRANKRRNSRHACSDSEEESGSDASSNFSDGYKRHQPRRPAVRTTRSGPTRTSGSTRAAARPDKRKVRRPVESSDDDSDDKPRQPSRSTSKAVRKQRRGRSAKAGVSYKEHSEEETGSEDLIEVDYGDETSQTAAEVGEVIEKILKRRRGRKGATGSVTTFYNVREHGDPNEDSKLGNDMEEQYLVKWKGWSHIHNTWESEHTLKEQHVGGMKRLEKFQKTQDQLQQWKSYASPEEIEYYYCSQEMNDDLIDKCCYVERIIAHFQPKKNEVQTGLPDYLVKWHGLSYAEASIEDGKLISELFNKEVKAYNIRRKAQTTPRSCRALTNRPKFQIIQDQPKFIGPPTEDNPNRLELRDYQLQGLNWLVSAWCRNNGVILADEMGLGKTIQTISFLSYLMNTYQLYGPFLLVVPLSTVTAWQLEFEKWAPTINVVVYLGDVTSRQTIREYEWCFQGTKKLKFNVLVTTYELLLKDKAFIGSVSWSSLIVDEAHRLKNDDSLLYKCLVEFDTNHRILVTGTPLQNSLKELWSLLHFIMPDKFDSWPDFEERHHSSAETGFSQLHKELEPFLLRRMKKDVEKSLPAKTEQILRVEMSKKQKQYYKWVLTKNYKALSKGQKGSVSSFINIVMELKKCCNHCFLVRQPDEDELIGKERLEVIIRNSGKLLLLDKLLLRLRESGHRVLIFSQMVRMLDILAEYLALRRFPYQRLDGSIRGEVRKQSMDHFNAEGSTDFCFLLSTKAGGLGVNLATADTVIIFDSDWNPQNDLQAQARAHRIGQKKQVSVYRLVTKNSVEEDIVERAKKKMVLDHLVIQRMDTSGRTVLNKAAGIGSSNPFNKDELDAILKFGAEELFKESEGEEEEPMVDLDLILNRAETRALEDKNTSADELLSQFKVVSFNDLEDQEIEKGPAWESIIPEADRKKIEQEETEQKLMEMNLPPRERKQIRDLNKILDVNYKRKKEDSESDDDSEEDSEDDDKPKKRGRPGRYCKKGPLSSFTNAEIRQFIKSFKKFPRPLDRLDDIAGDAELQEKSHKELKEFGDYLKSQCESVMKEYQDKIKEDPATDSRKTHRSPTLKLGSVSVNAKSLLQSEIDLEPLAAVMPTDKALRKAYKINFLPRTVHYDCPWEKEDDEALLRGVYEYGLGSWEAMKMDPELKLQDKILPDGDSKPQAKHLQARCDLLLKHLKRVVDFGKLEKQKKTKKEKKEESVSASSSKTSLNVKGVKSKEFVDTDTSSDDQHHKPDKSASTTSIDRTHKKNKVKSGKVDKDGNKTERKHTKKETEMDEDMEEGEVKDEHNKKKNKKKKKHVDGPKHFTTNDTVEVGKEDGKEAELPKKVFVECKEMMRPVKKYLKKLDNPEPGSEKDQLHHTYECLVKIGDRINDCLLKLHDPEIIKERRNQLWMFVSQFTEFKADRLHKMFRKAARKRDAAPKKSSQESQHSQEVSSSYHTQYDSPEKSRRSQPHSRWSESRSSYTEGADAHSDTSKDSLSVSASRPTYRGHNDRFHEVKESEAWNVNSPLSRGESAPHKDRAHSSYDRLPNDFAKFENRGPDGKRYHKDNRNRPYDYKNRSNYSHQWSDYNSGYTSTQYNRPPNNQGYSDPRRFNRKRHVDSFGHDGRPPKDMCFSTPPLPPPRPDVTASAAYSTPRLVVPPPLMNTAIPPPFDGWYSAQLPPPST